METYLTIERAVALFGIGFTVWAFYVRQGANAVKGMKASIETVVGLKLTSMESKLSEAVDSLHHVEHSLRNLELEHEKRLVILEERITRRRETHLGGVDDG